jgi:hypothetical protein
MDIVAVEPVRDRILLLTFANGERRVIDIAQHVAFEGVFEPLKDDVVFRSVQVDPDAGTIAWPNGADLCPENRVSEQLVARRVRGVSVNLRA